MKRSIKILLFLLSLLSLSPTFAVGTLDHFRVVLSSETAKVGEALDITISAVDKNSEIITEYNGSILVFSESDAEAEFPNELAENSYSFTAADEGNIKFENAVKFQNSGVQDIYVYDLNDENILGIAEVTITEEVVLSNVEIELLSPENGVTIGENNVSVSGRTQKNHQVRIILNDSQDIFTTSNAEGIFEKELENLQEGTNSIQAYVLNADDKKIGESKKIEIKINSTLPEFKKITINPVGEIDAESEISIKVISNIGLTKVNVIINDVITELKEKKDGIYIGKTLAPKEAGSYEVDVLLSDEFAHEVMEKSAETIIVIPGPELEAGSEEIIATTVIETIEIPTTTSDEKDLDLIITDIQVTELKTKSILTWKALEDAESYNVYKKISDTQIELLENVSDPRFEINIIGEEIRYEDFAIKAIGKTSSGEIIQGSLSEMTKVQTGPEMYIFLALIAMLLSTGIFFFRKNRV